MTAIAAACLMLTGCTGRSSYVIDASDSGSMSGITPLEQTEGPSRVSGSSVDGTDPFETPFILYTIPDYGYTMEVINTKDPVIITVRTEVQGWNFYSPEFSLTQEGEEILTSATLTEDDICTRTILNVDGEEAGGISNTTITEMSFLLRSVESVDGGTLALSVPATYTDETGFESDEIPHTMYPQKTYTITNADGEQLREGGYVMLEDDIYLVESVEYTQEERWDGTYCGYKIHMAPVSSGADYESIYDLRHASVKLIDKDGNSMEGITAIGAGNRDDGFLTFEICAAESDAESAAELIKNNRLSVSWDSSSILIDGSGK